MNALPIVYCRGYAGPTSTIDTSVDDPFYGFNLGATHSRVNGDGNPRFYQFEGPMLRLISEQGYTVPVHGSQTEFLAEAAPDTLDPKSIWISRFYDAASTTWNPDDAAHHENVFQRLISGIHDHFTADGFDIERAAAELYDLVVAVIDKTEGADRVNIVAHSMGGLVARCMMQKICPQKGKAAKDLVARFFTYATPHGGIEFTGGVLNWAMDTFGPAGGDIFSPPKMYGYLTPGKKWGDLPPDPAAWDPRVIPADVLDVNDVFCLIGTDYKDYDATKYIVGPQSDGLVRIGNAYVKNAHRAFAYKSHSGRYGEVNSEEGYQNLQRFLFADWQVDVGLVGLAAEDPGAQDGDVAWQADLSLAVRGLSVLITQQSAAHDNPIQLSKELALGKGIGDSPDTPVPLVSTFLFKKEPPVDLPATTVTAAGDSPTAADDGAPDAGILGLASMSAVETLSRYALSLKVYQVATKATGAFDFTDNLEQVGDWSDVLIVDVGSSAPGAPFGVWWGWNSEIAGSISAKPQMDHLLGDDGVIELPALAKALPIFGAKAQLKITVTRRSPVP
ncbi:esterase/lipase family protein [Microbacterium mangrovi]|nr:hypothetical protein [Microbacterium mangrovi]